MGGCETEYVCVCMCSVIVYMHTLEANVTFYSSRARLNC